MGRQDIKEYEKYCKDKNYLVTHKDTLEHYRREVLLNEKSLSKSESYDITGSIVNHYRTISRNKNGGKELLAKSVEDFNFIHINSTPTRKQYEKNFKRVCKIALDNNINSNPTPKTLTEEQYNKVCDILIKDQERKGKVPEQIKKYMSNYSQAYAFAITYLGPELDKEQAYRQDAIEIWTKPNNNEDFRPFFDITNEKNIQRAVKLLKEYYNIKRKTEQVGSKTYYNTYPSHLKRYMKCLLAYTDKKSLYDTTGEDFKIFVTAMQEFDLAASTQQNGCSAVRYYARKMDFRYRDTIPETNVGIGAEKRIYAKIDNCGTQDEFDKARTLALAEKNLAVYYAITLAGIGLRIEELTDEITLKKLEKALETKTFHVDDGKGARPRNTELYNDKLIGYVREVVDFMKANNIKGNPFAALILNPKGMGQRELIKSIESWVETRRFKFQDEDRIKRVDILRHQKDFLKNGGERDNIVLERCFITMHSWRAMYASNAYEFKRNQLIQELSNLNRAEILRRMKKFYNNDIQAKYEENKQRKLEGKKLLKVKGHYVNEYKIEEEIMRFIEKVSLLYAAEQVGHSRDSVTKIYCARLIDGKKIIVDLDTLQEYNIAGIKDLYRVA